MKAVTVRQPWASLIAAGVKTVETRPRATGYRGRIAIHAAKRLYTAADKHADRALWHRAHDVLAMERNYGVYCLPYGEVVASAVLTDCVPINERPARPFAPNVYELGGGRTLILRRRADEVWPESIEAQRPFGDFSPGRWALLLDDIKPTTERCPQCWGDGPPVFGGRWWCEVCNGDGKCDPVPARGQQAVPWEWHPSSPG